MGLHITELTEGSDTPETIVLDLTDAEVKKFKVGQKITVTIKGSVGMLSVPPQGSSKDFPAEMGIRMTDKTIRGSNVFAELSEDHEEEE
jgi:hypothetical protein